MKFLNSFLIILSVLQSKKFPNFASITDNFELIDFTVDDSSDEYLAGSISVKKQYEELNIDYNNLVEDFKKLSEENEEINEIND